MYANRFFALVVVMALAAVIALTVHEAVATSASALDPQAPEAQRLERGRAADAARWTAMGEYYGQLEAAQLQRSRWNAMFEHHQNLEEAQSMERSREAETARWNAMAEYYQREAQK